MNPKYPLSLRMLSVLLLLLVGFALTGCNTNYLVASPNPLSFGDVVFGQSKDMTVTFTANGPGGTPITGGSLTISGANSGDFQVVSQNFVGGRGTTTALIRFTPSANGTRTATLTAAAPNAPMGGSYIRTVAMSGSTVALSANLSGDALRFDAQTSSVTIPHNAALNQLPLTVEAWIRTTQTTGTANLISKYSAQSSQGWQMFLSNGKLSALYFGGGAGNAVYDSTGAFTSGVVADGQWHHLAFTVDISGGKLYVDGILKNSRGWTGTPTQTDTIEPLVLGASPGTPGFLGEMDEVRVWNRARTAVQITHNSRATQRENETGLLAYYRFDEGKGTTTVDATANHLDGTLSSGLTWIQSTAPIDTVIVSAGVTRSFPLAGFDPNGRALTFAKASDPAKGTLSVSSPSATYIPGANYAGSDTFTYTASNGSSVSEPTTVRIQLPSPPVTPTLLAYDGFDYAEGASLNGQNGGFGFVGGWTNGTGHTIAAPSLAFGTLPTTGGRVLIRDTSLNNRTLATPLGENGTTAYFSFLFCPEGALIDGKSVGLGILGSTNIFIGKPSIYTQTQYVIEKFGGDGQQVSGVPVRLGETVLLVVRADFRAGNDTLRLYVNPIPGAPEPEAAQATLSAFDLGTVNGLQVNNGAAGTVAAMDEFRVGRTFEAVTSNFVEVSGNVTLQGITPLASSQALTFTARADGQPDVMVSQLVPPDGFFSISLPKRSGTLTIKGDKYLAARINLNTIGGDVSGITALLRAGDANNDNAVDVADLLLIINHFNQRRGSSGYLEAADFNGDDANDVADLLLVIGNYNQIGD